MEQNSGVVFGDAQELSDVFSWALLEDTQRDDSAVNLAELCHAGTKAHLLHGTLHELVGKFEVSVGQLECFDCIVGTGPKMTATMIARRVADDGRKDGDGIAQRFELTCLDQINQRTEAFLNAVDRVFRSEPFASRHGGQGAPLGLG